MFCKKVAQGKTAVVPESLPPTSDAAKFHSMRVYHQVQVWKGKDDLCPKLWGWKCVENTLVPIALEQAPAPEALLKILRCGCKTDCRSKLCSCFKHDLKCSNLCSGCCGVSCLNAQETLDDNDYEEQFSY